MINKNFLESVNYQTDSSYFKYTESILLTVLKLLSKMLYLDNHEKISDTQSYKK